MLLDIFRVIESYEDTAFSVSSEDANILTMGSS